MARNRSTKAAVEVEDDELEELEEVEEAPRSRKSSKKSAPVEEKPARKSRRASAEDDEETQSYGASWLADYVNEQCDKNYTAANIRVLLRKLAADGTLDRAVGEDRSRYAFSGPNDPIVKAVVKHVKDGTLDKAKEERLADVKAKKAAKKAKAAAAEVDEDEDEDEVETPAPKKRATRRR